jgi:hypothetical protein
MQEREYLIPCMLILTGMAWLYKEVLSRTVMRDCSVLGRYSGYEVRMQLKTGRNGLTASESVFSGVADCWRLDVGKPRSG